MADNTTLREMAGMRHDSASGRKALTAVMDALEGLRPDLAFTVLASATGAIAMLLPQEKRLVSLEACRKLALSSLLNAEELERAMRRAGQGS